MASIGEIITTPQGLAVVVQVLPTQLNVGSQVLSQVVAAPLGGGPAPFVPPPAASSPAAIFSPAVQAQAAAVFVAAVLDTATPTQSTSSTPAAPSGGTAGSGTSAATSAASGVPGIPGAIPPTAFASASSAYQSTANRSTQSEPSIVLVG